MELKRQYTWRELHMLEHYLFSLYEYTDTVEFQMLSKEKRYKIYDEIRYIDMSVGLLRDIYENPEELPESYVAYCFDVDKRKRTRQQNIYKIGCKTLLFRIFKLKNNRQFQAASEDHKLYGIKAHNGFVFMELNNYIDTYGNPGFNIESRKLEVKTIEYEKEST